LGVSDPHYIEADTLGSCFKVTFRDARYLYPLTGKFHLHLLTVLHADKIVVLGRGGVEAMGRHAELLAVSETSTLWPANGWGSVPGACGEAHCVASAVPVTPNPHADEQRWGLPV